MAIGNTPQDRPALSEEQRQHFLEHGWVRIPKAIPPENIEKFSSDVWVRLGYDKDDMSTWKQEQVSNRMPAVLICIDRKKDSHASAP